MWVDMVDKNTKRGGRRVPLRAKGRTLAGTHVPIMVSEVIGCLDVKVGDCVVDCTLGYGGHAREFVKRIGNDGRLVGLDVDGAELEKTKYRLGKLNAQMGFYRRNFGAIDEVFAEEGGDGFDVIFADIGVSSMQVDDATRGISYKADGPLDMRMDDRRVKTGTDLLAELTEQELSDALWELSDEPDHAVIAQWIAGQRQAKPIARVDELVRLVFNAKGMTEQTWKKQQKGSRFGSLHPAARTFQTLRILVNDELGSLRRLLEVGPACLRPGGRIGVISFHSGEDRMVQRAFKEGHEAGVYSAVSDGAVKPRVNEVQRNPRSSSARFRWAVKV